MNNPLRVILNRIHQHRNEKTVAESVFWQQELANYLRWYHGELPVYYGTAAPTETEKISVTNRKDSALLTWFHQHQKKKYLYDLRLRADAFEGKKVLDVGAGPFPSGLAFHGCDLYCLDPLYHQYLKAGYPLHYYGPVTFVHAAAENMPLEDCSIDAVIAVNAIDHFDDLERAAGEIRRVLRPGGQLAMHVHYHGPMVTEPLTINDGVIQSLFGWCPNLRKVHQSNQKFGWKLPPGDESYVLWRNF